MLVHALGLGLIRAALRRALPLDEAVIRAPCRICPGDERDGLARDLLHVMQPALWAVAFLWTGAMPTVHQAMLYSLGAMTTNGHVAIYLDPHWQMLGALEALNGAILLGLAGQPVAGGAIGPPVLPGQLP